MVEVLKTDVRERYQADILLGKIHEVFSGYTANFDLDDCDKILRIESAEPTIETEEVVLLLNERGFYAELLTDDIYEPIE